MKTILFSVCLLFSGVALAKGSAKVCYKIEGMMCNGCANTIQSSLMKTKGVTAAESSFEKKSASVTYDPGDANVSEIKKIIDGLGYKAVETICKAAS